MSQTKDVPSQGLVACVRRGAGRTPAGRGRPWRLGDSPPLPLCCGALPAVVRPPRRVGRTRADPQIIESCPLRGLPPLTLLRVDGSSQKVTVSVQSPEAMTAIKVTCTQDRCLLSSSPVLCASGVVRRRGPENGRLLRCKCEVPEWSLRMWFVVSRVHLP